MDLIDASFFRLREYQAASLHQNYQLELHLATQPPLGRLRP